VALDGLVDQAQDSVLDAQGKLFHSYFETHSEAFCSGVLVPDSVANEVPVEGEFAEATANGPDDFAETVADASHHRGNHWDHSSPVASGLELAHELRRVAQDVQARGYSHEGLHGIHLGDAVDVFLLDGLIDFDGREGDAGVFDFNHAERDLAEQSGLVLAHL